MNSVTEKGTLCGIPKYFVGVISIVLVTLLWTILGDYDKPFFLTYLSCVSFQVYYLFLWVPDPVSPVDSRIPNNASPTVLAKEDKKHDRLARSSPIPSKAPVFTGKVGQEQGPILTFYEIAKLGFLLFVLYVGACYLSNISFQYTSVSSSTIMATTNGIFLLFFGVIAATDTPTYLKFAAAIISSLGAFILIYFEAPQGTWRIIGNLMSLGSASFYALYSVLLKKIVKDESRVSIPILFAVVGTYTTLLLWPLLIILDKYNVETFQLPNTAMDWVSILTNIILGSLLPNYLWNVAFMLTTPLVVAIGVSFTVPITLLFEYFYGKEAITWIYIVSGSLVIAGFLLINYSTLYPQNDCDCEIPSSCCK